MNADVVTDLRGVRDRQMSRHQYRSALFISDKILARGQDSATVRDNYLLAKCLYYLGEYHRAAFWLVTKGIDQQPYCQLLLAHCYYKSKDYAKGLKLIIQYRQDETKCPQEFDKHLTAMLVLQCLFYQAIDNREEARDSLFVALENDFKCYEAFEMLVNHHMISKTQEIETLNKIIKENIESNPIWVLFVRFWYYLKLKKYDKPDELRLWYRPFDQFFLGNHDYLVAMAERFFYNCRYALALEITTKINKEDLYNLEALVIHISVLLQLGNKDELFKLAQRLIDIYPNREISWYALGCYYHLVQKVELARRFLLKATSLNNVFAAAWMLYGHSFSQEAEHDQAMAVYFKASHLMPGCHLPLLYIGVEYILTENFKTAEKFIVGALSIAPEDPTAYHEFGIIAFNMNEYGRAEKHFSTALTLAGPGHMIPRYEALLRNLGHTYRKLGDYPRAIELFENALTVGPEQATTYSGLGLVCLLMGDWTAALNYLDTAHSLQRLLFNDHDENIKVLLEQALLRFKFTFPGIVNRFEDRLICEYWCNEMPKVSRIVTELEIGLPRHEKPSEGGRSDFY